MCGCSKVTIDGVSDMLYERQDALEAMENPEEKTGEVGAIYRRVGFRRLTTENSKPSTPPPPAIAIDVSPSDVQARLKLRRRWCCAKGYAGDVSVGGLLRTYV